MLQTIRILIFITMVSAITSCGSLKQLQYLQGPIDSTALSKINFKEPFIQEGDLISITVYSDNQLASGVYNLGGVTSTSLNAGGSGGGASSAGPGYLVDKDGRIQMYGLGVLKVEGMTRKELADSITRTFNKMAVLQNPYIDVRFLNFKITIIGDVSSPGPKTFTNEKVSIFDAISMAGDMTPYARRDNVLIVRESTGVREFARLDMTDPNIFNSPYFYLQQNDLVIVDPSKAKATVNDQTYRNVSIATSLISIIAIVYSIFRNN